MNSQKSVENLNTKILEVTAQRTGNIHYYTSVELGSGVEAYGIIGQIIDSENSKLIVESYLSPQDISKISINDQVQISIDGINQTKYGSLEGTVKKIGLGTVTRTNSQNVQTNYYPVEVSLDTTELKNKSEKVQAKSSMPVSVNINYKRETYLYWLLNQLNFSE
nr:HlyD family efflux transporter periplasmic adaptor subunit [Marinilactibacillus kalidii]